MILVDYRAGGEKPNPNQPNVPQQLVGYIRANGIASELSTLEFGDFAFEGHGPDGTMMVGIERKTLHDLLNCIDDARLAGHQRIGMKQMYSISIVMLEGHWKPHDPDGVLMEGFNGGVSWGYCRYRSQRTLYAKLYRYLISLQLGGMILSYSRDPWHTAYNVCEWFHYMQKGWEQHLTLKEIHRVALPGMNLRPPLVRKWANDLDGIGTKMSELAERHFKTPLKLANSDEMDWLRIPGVGVATAQDIMRQIWGGRK